MGNRKLDCHQFSFLKVYKCRNCSLYPDDGSVLATNVRIVNGRHFTPNLLAKLLYLCQIYREGPLIQHSTFAHSLTEILNMLQVFNQGTDKGQYGPQSRATLQLALINLLLVWLVITSLNWCREQTERINTQTLCTHTSAQPAHCTAPIVSWLAAQHGIICYKNNNYSVI